MSDPRPSIWCFCCRPWAYRRPSGSRSRGYDPTTSPFRRASSLTRFDCGQPIHSHSGVDLCFVRKDRLPCRARFPTPTPFWTDVYPLIPRSSARPYPRKSRSSRSDSRSRRGTRDLPTPPQRSFRHRSRLHSYRPRRPVTKVSVSGPTGAEGGAYTRRVGPPLVFIECARVADHSASGRSRAK